jgi:hypothetical protein
MLLVPSAIALLTLAALAVILVRGLLRMVLGLAVAGVASVWGVLPGVASVRRVLPELARLHGVVAWTAVSGLLTITALLSIATALVLALLSAILVVLVL